MEKNTIETETIELKHPFEFEGEKIEKVYFKKRMKAKDILASEAEMRARGGFSPAPSPKPFILSAGPRTFPLKPWRKWI